MGMFLSLDTASSALTAQRLRMDVISNNIANVNTTRTPEGEPFRRSRVVLRPRQEGPRYRSPFLPKALNLQIGTGVRVVKIEKDPEPGKLVFDPTHPDACKHGPKKGHVEMPNVNVVTEMVDLISATRSYEANVTMLNTTKQLFLKALEIGR